jgi:hypothetical protein
LLPGTAISLNPLFFPDAFVLGNESQNAVESAARQKQARSLGGAYVEEVSSASPCRVAGQSILNIHENS